MLFCSTAMNRKFMYHTTFRILPESSIKTMGDFTLDLGLDDHSVHIPTIDPLPSKFLLDQCGVKTLDLVLILWLIFH